MESGGEYTYAYSLLTPWSRMHSFEGGREGDNSRTMQRAEEGRKGARDAEALIRGAAGSAGSGAVGANGVNGPCEVKDRPMPRMRDGSRRVGGSQNEDIISI